MQRLCVCMLILALALAAFSEASWKPHSQLQDTLSGPGTNRGLEPHGLDQLGPVSHHRRQLGPQGPPRSHRTVQEAGAMAGGRGGIRMDGLRPP